MKNKIETLLIEKIQEAYLKDCSIILMTKYDFKKLISEINITFKTSSFKQMKKQEKRFMGLKIYITKDLKKEQIIVK